MDKSFIIAQIIGFIGTGFIALSFQCKSSRKLFLLQTTCNALYVVHFIILGGYAAVFSSLVSMTRNLVLTNHKHRWAQWKGWLPIVLAACTVITIFNRHDPFSLIASLSTIPYSIVCWTRNGKWVRIASLSFFEPSWLAYDIYFRSISGAVAEILMISSIIISFFRYGAKALDGDGESTG